MLSVLIPTYNYNCYSLVEVVYNLCFKAGIEFEIICQDDASNSNINLENQKINQLQNCIFLINETNLGRAKNRNSLAAKSKFNWLLFLDCDTKIVRPNFIENYLKQIENPSTEVVNGGILYQVEKPAKESILRWIYGVKREALSVTERNKKVYLSFLSLNFLIKKEVFEKVKFNENIPNFRHEDTLFSFNLKINNIDVLHIKNPVYHLGLESSAVFLKKSEESAKGLIELVNSNLIDKDYLKISTVYFYIKNLHLISFFSFIYRFTKNALQKNLLSENPSLKAFDWYRLLYICSLKL